MQDAKLFYERYKGNTVVYVDDELDNLMSFEMHVEDYFDFAVYEDPREALEYIVSDDSVSVVLIDQVMPHLSGMQLVQEIKKQKPSLICMMITGNATKQLAIEAVKENLFWDFFEKPIDFGSSEMRQKIVNGIQQHLFEKTKTDFREGTLELLANLIDDKDGHTHRHSIHVTEWAVKIGRKMNLSERELVMLREGSLIHDIGKISIPDDILKKPGRLSALERKIIMTHAARGGDLIERVPQLRELASMARDHHERPDGKGYPMGKKAEEIPLLTSIVALADFFEALSSKRPYKEPWVIKDIVMEVEMNRNTQFKGEVVDALFEVLAEEQFIDFETIQGVKQKCVA